MPNVQHYTDKVNTKRVYYTGADQLFVGYVLCYDRDNITATARGPGFHQGLATLAQGAALTAGYESYARALYVEKPTAANADEFAGVVAPESDGVTGPGWITITEPSGRVSNVHTEESTTIDVTLLAVKPASYALGSSTEGANVVAKAMQTIDRSSINGLCQAVLFAPLAKTADVFTASSRTTVQLPTAAIWNNFPIDEMRRNPFLGSLYESDFRHGASAPANAFVDATYAASAAGKTQVQGIYPGITAIGELIFFTTEDNSEAACQWACPIDIAGGNIWAFEIRVKCVNITTEKGSWFVGLQTGVNLAGDQQVDTGVTPSAVSDIGFNTDAAATSALDTTYLLTGQSRNEHAAGIHTLVQDTYVTLALYYNGTDIEQYVNGVAAGTDILGTGDMDQVDFPLAAILVPGVAVKAAHADDYTITLDWIRVAQAP